MHKIRLNTFQINKSMNYFFLWIDKFIVLTFFIFGLFMKMLSVINYCPVGHLDFEEGRAKGRPLVDYFEEAQFGIFSRFSCVLVEQRHDGLEGSQIYSEPLAVKPRTNPLTWGFCKQDKENKTADQCPHSLPVVGGQISDLVLGNKILQDLGDVVEVGLVLLVLHPVDQRRQLVQVLLWTLVVAPKILWQLL